MTQTSVYEVITAKCGLYVSVTVCALITTTGILTSADWGFRFWLS